jgi:Xaa-Pro aminopeptidase
LLLVDMGAEVNGYAADMTRCRAIDGVMSKRQFEVYDQVVALIQVASDFIRPGKSLQDLNQYMRAPLAECLAMLGLINGDEQRSFIKNKDFMPHGFSHFLGMDVHDYGDKYQPLEAGMVVTCEPGIYIVAEGLGIRLENDLLITETGNENLLANFEL